MNILVIGGAGYIGGHLVDLLQDNGMNVTVYDNLLYERQYFKNTNFVYGDVRDTFKLKKLLENTNYQYVIWLAALVGDGACSIDEKLTYEINVNSLDRFLKIFKENVIFMSTCSVYGKNEIIINEEGDKNPQSIYAKSKIKAEQLFSKRDNFTILRLGTLFGISDYFSRVRLDLVVNILTLKASKKEKISVFGGNQYRPLLHVKDVGNALHHIIKNKVFGIFNLAYKNFTILEIAKEIIKNFDNKVEIEIEKKQFEDSRNYQVSSKKIYDTGFSCKFDLDFGINEMKNIFLDNRIKNTSDPIFSNFSYLSIKNDLR